MGRGQTEEMEAEGAGGDQPLTIGEALARRDQRLFVGRDREMSAFGSWLSRPNDGPRMLAVVGPGGVGKSTLLRAFRRHLHAAGRATRLVDGRVTDASPAGLAAALGARQPDEALEDLAASRAVLILDSFGYLRPLTHYLLEEFFPALSSEVAVVIASREDLTSAWRPWREVIEVLNIGGLAGDSARELLRRRGISSPDDIERIVTVAKGHPLSLSMAADLTLRGVIGTTSDLPEWNLAVRTLVEDLLRDVTDPDLKAVLEAAAVVRQFDETTLAVMSAGQDISSAFARLCSMSIVRPGPRGLMLHDDVRGAIRDDLRWRKPERYQEMRRRILDHYRRMVSESSDPDVVSSLVTEAAYLSEEPVMQIGIFGGDDPSDLWTEPARPADRTRLIDLRNSFAASLPGRSERPAPEELDPTVLDGLIGLPESRFRLAWSRTHGPIGYGLALPITAAVLEVLPADGAITHFARHALGVGPHDDLGRLAQENNAWFLGTIVSVPDHRVGAAGVLSREILPLLADSHVLLAVSGDPTLLTLFRAMGFYDIGVEAPEGGPPGLEGLMLDLRMIGTDAFIERLATGKPMPRPPAPAAVEAGLEDALEHWDDDRHLEASVLGDLACTLLDFAPHERASAVRSLITEALRLARHDDPSGEPAFRALEAGYMEGTTKLETAARRLSVSRPTFYRLRKRALRSVAECMVASARAGQLRPGGPSTRQHLGWGLGPRAQ